MGCGIMHRAAGGVVFVPVWAAESDSGKNGDNTTITSQKTVCTGGVLLYFKLYAPNLRNIIFIAIFALRRRGEEKGENGRKG